MPAELVPAGLTIDTLDEARLYLATSLRIRLGAPNLQAMDPDSAVGQFVSALAERWVLTQELVLGLYGAAFPDSAAGAALDSCVAFAGLLRGEATPTTGICEVTNPNPPGGGPLTVPQGALLQNVTTGDLYSADAAVTIADGATSPVLVTALEPGPTVFPAGITWQWASTFAGSTELTILNALPGTAGEAAETDAELRARFWLSRQRPGAGTFGAVRAALLELDGVVECVIYENTSMVVGILTPEAIPALPPKAFAACVRGGAAADIAECLWTRKPVGIETYGGTSLAVTDSQGHAHTLRWQTAAARVVHIEVTITGSAASYDTAIKAAVAAYGDTLTVGADVIALRVIAAALGAAGDAVTALTAKIDTVDPPVATGNLAIPWTHYASILAVNVDVVHI